MAQLTDVEVERLAALEAKSDKSEAEVSELANLVDKKAA